MAEVGLVASVVQLAGFGLKLSISLYAFAESVSSADKDIKHIAKDVSLTSAVLNELGENLKYDKQTGIASDNAIKTADEVVHECSEVFREIDIALDKGTGKGTAKRSLGRLKWPFLQPKMELLRSNLERLKSTLILMLHVLTYATKRKQHTVKASQTDFERQQIQNLIIANQRAVAGFERLSLTSGAPSEHVADEIPQNPRPISSNPNAFGKGHLDSTPNNDPIISLMARPDLMPLSPGRAQNHSEETIDSAFSAAQDSPEAALPQGHIQMMSSMHATALFQWLQKAGAIVEDTWSARTMLTATSILPAASDLPRRQQAPIENAKNGFGSNSDPTADDVAFHSLENKDILDNFDFDKFLRSNDESNDFNPTNSPPDGAETIPGSKDQSTTYTSKEKMPPILTYKGTPPVTSDKDKTYAELNQGFDADRVPTDGHPPHELFSASDLDFQKHPTQKPSQPTKQPTPQLFAADLQEQQNRIEAFREASMKEASIARPSNPTPAQDQRARGPPPPPWLQGVPISQGASQLTHDQFQLPSQEKMKNDLGCAVSEKISGLESRLGRSKELRLEAEGEARKIYQERLEALHKLEDKVRNVLVLQEEAKRKEEAEEALHIRMRDLRFENIDDGYPQAQALTHIVPTATLDKAGYSAESVARLLKGKEERSSEEEKTVEEVYLEVNALREGRMDGYGYHERIGDIDLNRPTWIKVRREYLSPDTLDLYELPWEWDERNSAYILIKRWIPLLDQDILFEHTRQTRQAQASYGVSQRTVPYTKASLSPGPHLRRGLHRELDNSTTRPLIKNASRKSPTRKRMGGGGGGRYTFDTFESGRTATPKPPPKPRPGGLEFTAVNQSPHPSTEAEKDAAAAAKESLFPLDTDLADMERVLDIKSPDRTTPGDTEYSQHSIKVDEWDAPESWAVKKIGDLLAAADMTDGVNLRDALNSTEEEAASTQTTKEDDDEGTRDEVDELLGRWTTL